MKSKGSPPIEDWTLSGKICLGRKWNKKKSHFFRITFQAHNYAHARKIGLERLRALTKNEKSTDPNIKKVSLAAVILVNGVKKFYLKPRFANNSIIVVKQPAIVFQEVRVKGA